MDQKFIETIKSIATVKKLQKGEILFYEGEMAEAFYILLDGELKIYKTGNKSNEIILHHLKASSMVAEMASIEKVQFPASASAQSNDTKVAVVRSEIFLNFIEQNPEFSWQLIKSLTQKIKGLEKSINRNLVYDAMAKVCSLLLEQPSILKRSKNIEIANVLNITPETLSRTLRKLKDLEILNENNEVCNVEKLKMFL